MQLGSSCAYWVTGHRSLGVRSPGKNALLLTPTAFADFEGGAGCAGCLTTCEGGAIVLTGDGKLMPGGRESVKVSRHPVRKYEVGRVGTSESWTSSILRL